MLSKSLQKSCDYSASLGAMTDPSPQLGVMTSVLAAQVLRIFPTHRDMIGTHWPVRRQKGSSDRGIHEDEELIAAYIYPSGVNCPSKCPPIKALIRVK